MQTHRILPGLVVLLLMSGPALGTTVIDEFSDGLFNIYLIGNDHNAGDTIVNDQDNLSEVLGDRRQVTLTYDSGNGSQTNRIEAKVETGLGRIDFSADTGIPSHEGKLLLEYLGGSAGGSGSDLNADLAPLGETGVFLDVVVADQGFTATLTLSTDGTTKSASVVDATCGTNYFVYWDFSAFPGIDPNDIDYLSVEIDGDPALDLTARWLKSDVPEPVTMAGLLMGVGGLAGYLRKRRFA